MSSRPRRIVAASSAFSMVLSALSLLFAATLMAIAGGVALAPAANAAVPTSNSVSADGLPTVQIDGVVWKQAIAGNTVFAGGNFSNARPAGAAPGVNTVPRTNLLAYDIRTGVLIDSFAPTLNGEVQDMAVTPDGTKLVIAGSFTTVNGFNRYRVAEFNLSGTNTSNPTITLNTSFAPTVDSTISGVTATNSTVFIAGQFSSVQKQARARVAAVSTSNGAIQPFNVPVSNGIVKSIVVSPDGGQVVFAGNFTSVGGSGSPGTPGYGLYRANALTGAGLPLPVNNEVRNAGANAAILRLATDGTYFYGGGYKFGTTDSKGSEGHFMARWSDGSLVNLDDCHGDTYDIAPVGDEVYIASHKHYCGNSGGFPQTDPWTLWHSNAWTKSTEGTNYHDLYSYPEHPGTPRPGLVPFFPQTAIGTYTGKSQATWTVTGNSDYVLYGGEFPSVNGVAQQGLVRYATRSNPDNPNRQGPRSASGATVTPDVKSLEPGKVRVTWPAFWDKDDATLTYQVFRGDTSHMVYEGTQTAFQWNGQQMSFTDSGQTPGASVSYAIRVLDPTGNRYTSAFVPITVSGTDSVGTYGSTVLADGASKFWRLDEPSGTSVRDLGGTDNTTAGSGVTRNVPGALLNSSDTASSFSGGSSSSLVASSQLVTAPDTVSEEVWFKTNSTSGGKLAGFGNNASGTSSIYDRHLYMNAAGQLYFGVYTTGQQTINSTAKYNNNQWHQAVATLGSNGMALYVDGALVDSRADVTSGRAYPAYFRVGGDQSWSGNAFFKGTIDDVALYPTALTPQQVDNHWVASGRASTNPAPGNQNPTASFTATPTNLDVSVDGSASSDPDGTISSYTWHWGDGTPDTTGASPMANHSYATAGSKTVTLTVTDNQSATGSTSQTFSVSAAPAPNVKPTALFSATPTDLSVSVDGSASSDSDGTIAKYSWHWGDGTPDTTSTTMATANHSYATAGTKTVTLTVTDDDNATDAVSHDVTVSAAPAGSALATDDFGRTVANGWGTADKGGAWSVRGTASNFAVSGGTGKITVPTSGTMFTDLKGVSSTNTDSTVEFSLNKSGLVSYVGLTGRATGNNDYYNARARIDTDGTVKLYILRRVGDAVGAAYTVPGLLIQPNTAYKMRFLVTGTSPTTLSAKIWKSTDTEPAAWQKTATDSDANLQTAGYVGLYNYASSGGPLTASFDAFSVKDPTATGGNATPTAAFTSSSTDLHASVNGGGSSDSDGTISSYSWHWGDGTADTVGASATNSHDYAAGGTYPVTLTVTDNDGDTNSVTHNVAVTAPAGPNTPPVAAFTSSSTDLHASVNGGGSSDSDGTISSYSWHWGDGTADTVGASATNSHDYAAGGTYPVTLTVTDNDGDTNSVTHNVAVTAPAGPNTPPVAAFTSSTTNLHASVNGGGSSDSDGSITSYSWHWGDGTADTAAGSATNSHDYAAGGTYPVTLTVTDNGGAPNSVTHDVTVTAPAVTPLANDAFGRTVANGWGTADKGGAWTVRGAAANFAVSGGTGKITVPTSGTMFTDLKGVSSTSTDSTVEFSLSKVGLVSYVGLTGRATGNNDYYNARARIDTDGTVKLYILRRVGDAVGAAYTVPGLVIAPNTAYKMRFLVTGTSPTTLSAKVWKSTDTEPATWQKTATDTDANLQAAGYVGLYNYVSSGGPLTVSFDSYVVNPG